MIQKEMINEYTIIKRLGQGKFHTLYLVELKNKYHVLKLIQINKDNIDEATKKAQSYASLIDQNIVNATSFFYFNHQKYLALVLQYCPAGDLSKWIGFKTQQQAKAIIIQIASGLSYLHKKNIVHKDIRPQNILISQDIPKIAQLGMSKLVSNYSSTVTGTPFYLAPEGFKMGELDQKCDIWSLGIISLELLLGKRIYDIAPGTQAPAVREDFPIKKALKQIKDEQMRDLVQRMLNKKPQQRPSSRQIFIYLQGDIWQELQPQQNQVMQKAEEQISETNLKEMNSSYKFSETNKSGRIQLSNGNLTAVNPIQGGVRSFVEVEGTVLKKGSSIRFKVAPKVYIGLGLGIRNYQLSKKGFESPKDIQRWHTSYKTVDFYYYTRIEGKFQYGFYLVFNNGHIVYPQNKKHSEQYIKFRFIQSTYQQQGVIRLQTNENELIFIREKGRWNDEQIYKMPINLTQDHWKNTCFIVCMAGIDDTVTILPPLEPSKPKTPEYGCVIQ